MFNQKLFTVIFLLFGKVDNGDPCDQWYLDFQTKFHCEEYYRKHSTKTTITVTTITTKPTPTTSTTTTQSTSEFMPSTSSSFPTPIDYPTESTSTGLTTSTTSIFIPTISEPTAEPDDYSTIVTTVTMTTSTSTTENVTNGSGNRTPWFLSLSAMILYT